MTRRTLFAAAGFLTLVSCRSPMADVQITEQMRQLADELNGARQESAAMHEQIDSLRLALVHQDSLIRQLANLAGSPLPVK